MTTFEPRHTRSDAEGCGAVLAELRAQADAMRVTGDEKGADALLLAIGDITVIEGNVIRSTGPGIRFGPSAGFRFEDNVRYGSFDGADIRRYKSGRSRTSDE